MAVPQTQDRHCRAPRRAPERTCVGCGKRDAAPNLLRIVLGPEGHVAFDLANHAMGRGAHVHPAPQCMDSAARKGLSKAFHTRVVCEPIALRDMLAGAVERRLKGLLGSAIQSGNAVLGRQAVDDELGKNTIETVILACDASDAPGPALKRAIADGRAVAWGSKGQVGAALGRSEVGVVGIRSPSLGRAIADMCRIADGVRSCSEVR